MCVSGAFFINLLPLTTALPFNEGQLSQVVSTHQALYTLSTMCVVGVSILHVKSKAWSSIAVILCPFWLCVIFRSLLVGMKFQAIFLPSLSNKGDIIQPLQIPLVH